MREFIVLSVYDILALYHDKPVIVHIDGKPYLICSDEYFEKQKSIKEGEAKNEIDS